MMDRRFAFGSAFINLTNFLRFMLEMDTIFTLLRIVIEELVAR